MNLVIDIITVVNVGTLVGEAGFDGRIDQLLERAPPQNFRRRFEREIRDGFVVDAPQVAVDGEVRRKVIAWVGDLELRRVLQDGWHHTSEKPVVEIDRARAKLLREHAEVETAAAFVAHGVAREY